MKRDRAWRISVALSVAVLLGSGMLWLRSLWVRDRVACNIANQRVWVESFPHHVSVTFGKLPPDFVDSVFLTLQLHVDQQIDSHPKFWEVRWRRLRGGFTGVGIPYWLVVLLSSALPIRWVSLKLLNRQRHRRGLCAACGYDLRASAERCPECGEPIPRAALS